MADDQIRTKQIIVDLAKEYTRLQQDAQLAWRPGDKIPYAGRTYNEEEVALLIESALEFWLTSGKYTAQFEKSLADFIGTKYCAFVNSGSSANLLAVATLTSPLLDDRALRPGDEVITVAAGFPTTVAPLIQLGLVPVFVDVALPQYNVDVTQLDQALSSKTRAVILAHTLGNPFDAKAVASFCKRNNLWLIEDNCDALGSEVEIDGRLVRTGALGDIATSSFYPPHHITTGEGGAVYTSDDLLWLIIRSLRDWGRDCVCPSGQDNFCGHRFDGQFGDLPKGYDHKYVYSHFGYNLAATDLQAAIGCAQIEKLPQFIDARRNNFDLLFNHLSGCDAQLMLPSALLSSKPSWFGFPLTCQKDTSRDKLIRHLEKKGIQTRLVFAGNLLKQPCSLAQIQNGIAPWRVVGELENTNRIMNDTFWIGVYPGLSSDQLEYMAQTILDGLDIAAHV